MSTRYVWKKYNSTIPPLSYRTLPGSPITSGETTKACSQYSRAMVNLPVGQRLGFVPEGNIKDLNSAGDTVSCSQYPYIITFMNRSSTSVGYGLGVSSYGNWEVKGSSGALTVYNIYGGSEQSFSFADAQEVSNGGKGEFVSNQSAQSSSAYPTSGVDGSYYYEYLGSDSIDPRSLTYSDSSITPGNSITIRANTVNPTYGGTIYYQFSYSTNGGSTWISLGGRSTAASKSVTVPSDATQFRGRVIASDGWGFNSTTYITGSNLTVQSFKGYVGVNGKARSVSKIYVGVNGKAREVKAGYVGVNGKARKFM